jgi:8-hydroxy-5-deazaflavin:NADPH oxidoreductase
LAADKSEGRPLDVFIAGDEAEAKARVSSFIESLALRPLDVGGLKMAHWLEGAGLLMVAPLVAKAANGKNFWLGINSLG